MVPNEAERDALFKKFGRAFFKQDLDALYDVVTQDFTYSILVDGHLASSEPGTRLLAFFWSAMRVKRMFDLTMWSFITHRMRPL